MKTWKDIYKLPIKDSYIDKDDGFRSKRIVDTNMQFVFQFLNIDGESQIKILEKINGISELKADGVVFSHKDGNILANENNVIMIRGWGNLTGTGGHNLSSDEACNVQDTFADYIVEQLNK